MKRKVSVVIPCYNEEDNVERTYELVKQTLESIEGVDDYEIIFSDNDSQDSTVQIIRELANKDLKLKAILNNRNFGFDRSIFNAILASTGDAVVFLTCDGQEPVDMIPIFVNKWISGDLVVWGQKVKSKENWLVYRLRSVFYKVIEEFSSITQYRHVIGFGLYDKSVVNQFRKLKDPYPILRFIVPELGYKPSLVPYCQNKRRFGKSNFNFFKLADYALNSLVHTSRAPMKLMIYTGFIFSFFSFMIGAFYFAYKLFHWDSFSLGIAPIIILLSFVSSVLVSLVGFVGEYLLVVMDRVSFTSYVIEKERINFNEE